MPKINKDTGRILNEETKLINGQLSLELAVIMHALIRAYAQHVEDGKLFDIDLNDKEDCIVGGRKMDVIGKMQSIIRTHTKVADLVIDEEKKGNFDSIKTLETDKIYQAATEMLDAAKKKQKDARKKLN